MSKQSMEMALEFIQTHCATSIPALKAIAALKEVIAKQTCVTCANWKHLKSKCGNASCVYETTKQQGEPVGVVKHNGLGFPCVDLLGKNGAQYFGLEDGTKLYTSAPVGQHPADLTLPEDEPEIRWVYRLDGKTHIAGTPTIEDALEYLSAVPEYKGERND